MFFYCSCPILILLNSDSFSKNTNISPLHSVIDFNVYPLAKSASISFSIFLRLAPSCTVGSALLTIINRLSCQFVMLYPYTLLAPLSMRSHVHWFIWFQTHCYQKHCS